MCKIENRYVVYDEDEVLLFEGDTKETAKYLEIEPKSLRNHVKYNVSYRCKKYIVEKYQCREALLLDVEY